MNWKYLRLVPWIDTRAMFVSKLKRGSRLLDIGSSNGETLSHIHELRPDLKLFAADIAGSPERYPVGTHFVRLDITKEQLPWEDNFFDAVTCMHVVEHLADIASLIQNVAMLLKIGGRAYFETPDPKTTKLPSRRKDGYTFNFFDDPTHIAPVPIGNISNTGSSFGLYGEKSGISRNLLFACAAPFSTFFSCSRKRYTSRAHLIGWSKYIILKRVNYER